MKATNAVVKILKAERIEFVIGFPNGHMMLAIMKKGRL